MRGSSRAGFCQRVNRFTAWVELAGGRTLCHVKNTAAAPNCCGPARRSGASTAMHRAARTAYTLITVARDGAYFNLDSTAPNALAAQWLASGGAGFLPEQLRREVSWEDSRFDLAFQRAGKPCLLEVKGVTLARDGAGVFPDAPTQRGTRHVRTLLRAAQAGYGAYVLFVAAMEHVACVRPNEQNDPAFDRALVEAQQAGVTLLALRCKVEPDTITPLDADPGLRGCPVNPRGGNFC